MSLNWIVFEKIFQRAPVLLTVLSRSKDRQDLEDQCDGPNQADTADTGHHENDCVKDD